MKTTKPTAKLVDPGTYPNGACKGCVGGNKCAWHVAEDAKRDLALSATLRRTVDAMRAVRIARVCSRFEIESNEFEPREEIAARMLRADPLLA